MYIPLWESFIFLMIGKIELYSQLLFSLSVSLLKPLDSHLHGVSSVGNKAVSRANLRISLPVLYVDFHLVITRDGQ